MQSSCFHCGEQIPKGCSLFVEIDNVNQAMCCIGCQAVANAIVDNDLTEYYRFRTEPAQKNTPLVPQELQRAKLLDDESLQSEFIYSSNELSEVILTVEGISCAACAWLIEMQVSKLAGINTINVNATTQRATIRWNKTTISLSDILLEMKRIGYTALPFKASNIEKSNQQQSKQFVKRLGISGILMMQVMMIAIGLYFGAFSGMSDTNLLYLRWASLLLTVPIIFYGALPFYSGAIKALSMKRLSMDVPVSIAILLAFSASAWATISQQGEVYFESVSMFTFLLLIGKFLEFRARLRAAEVSANLLKLMPMTATLLIDGEEKFIAAKKLEQGNIVLVKPGETVPADGTILSGTSQLNEAMLSGEQKPISKTQGDSVFSGTINSDGNLTIEVKHNSQHSFLSQLIRLSESSQAHKPKIAQLSDKIAQYFVALILVMASATAIYWFENDPQHAFWITLSVLVATCPCALSLATPTALTCATSKLNKLGIMVKSGHVMETMVQVNRFAFDKTGTLTNGEFTLNKVELLDSQFTSEAVLSLTAALEVHSEHPIAKAFSKYRDLSLKVTEVKIIAGCGVEATYQDQRVKVGKVSWLSQDNTTLYSDAQCMITIDNNPIAAFYLDDNVRDDASALLAQLRKKDIKTLMLSGDSKAGCDKIQHALTLDSVFSNLSAQDKMEKIKQFDSRETVAMLGDGVNDAPVFGAAHVSIAMGSGTDIAKSGADVILLNNNLLCVNELIETAHKTKKIIWQNYCWAFGYNALVLPLAMAGFITPYFAVIGMSASSILVITNSLRLLTVKRHNKS